MARVSSSQRFSAITAAIASRTDIEGLAALGFRLPARSRTLRNVDRPQVFVTRRLPARAMARLEGACDVELHEGETLSRDALAERVRGKQALVTMFTDPVDDTVLQAGSDLRIVATVAVGYNNIDVAAARARGVVVTNTPDVLTEATADLTWSIILGLTRRIVEGDRLVRKGGWKGFAF